MHVALSGPVERIHNIGQLAENARARLVLKLGYREALLILLAYTGETSCIPS